MLKKKEEELAKRTGIKSKVIQKLAKKRRPKRMCVRLSIQIEKSAKLNVRRAGEGAGGAGGDAQAFRCEGRRVGEASRGGGRAVEL